MPSWTPPKGPCLGCLTLSSRQMSGPLQVVERFACDGYAQGRCIFCVRLDARRDSAKRKEEERSCRLPRQIQTNTKRVRTRSCAKKGIFVGLFVSRWSCEESVAVKRPHDKERLMSERPIHPSANRTIPHIPWVRYLQRLKWAAFRDSLH